MFSRDAERSARTPRAPRRVVAKRDRFDGFDGEATVTGTRAFWSCLLVLALAGTSSAAPVVRLNESKAGVTVDVTGVDREALAGLAKLPASDPRWAKVLAVYVGKGSDQPAVLGSHRIENGVLRFEPRFPFVRGVRYRVVFNPGELPGGKGSKPVEVVLSMPKPERKPTAVVANVYPSADRLPENLLRFYLHFSAPMSQGGSYSHIKLLDAKGKPIDFPFLELDQELWDPSGKRFTLFLDPGRVKRGLKPREEAGPVLEEGKRYTLVIEKTWKDAQGTPLKDTFRKTFTVGGPDEKPIDQKTWKLKAPPAGTQKPLRVDFGKSIDHGLQQRLVWVVDASGKKVAGKVSVADQERTWLFTPDRPWREGAHELVADTSLEDPCGNRIGRAFEVDVLRPVEREVKTETVKVRFRVRAAP
jgi:hypothetical protein